ncbi:MAG: tetratricopeptide repeat protein [bacterium]
MSVLVIVSAGAVVLVVGLLLGRYYVPDNRPLKRAAKEGALYIRGLNHVLSHDNDAAIAELTRAVSENTSTVDTYFALGVLFRERGEYERAVRVHQSILVRTGITRELRIQAHFQLGLDFESAGYHRRARKAFEEVLEKSPKYRQAAEKLLALYEAGGEWERAHKALLRVTKITKQRDSRHLSHVLAEMALDAMEVSNASAAKKLVNKALAANKEGVHPLHVSAVILRETGKVRAAGDTWLRAMSIAPDLSGFFFPFLEEAFFEEESLDALGSKLDELGRVHPDNLNLRLVQARFLGKRSPELAAGIIRNVLEDAPSLLPARRLAGRLVLAAGDADAIRAEYEALLSTLESIERSYRCARCGHTSRELFWRCPKCHAWDSVRVAWGRREGEGSERVRSVGAAIPGGPAERRTMHRR